MNILKILKISLSTILFSSILAGGRRVSRRKKGRRSRKSEVSDPKKKSKENIGKIEDGRISKKNFESALSFLLMSSFTIDFIASFIILIANDDGNPTPAYIFFSIAANIVGFIIKLVFSLSYIFSVTMSFSYALAFYNTIIILHVLFSSLFNFLFLSLFYWLEFELGGNNKYIVLILPIAETVIASFLDKQLSSSNWMKDKFLI